MAENLILMVIPVQRFFDVLGEPLAGGKLYSFVTGTSTPEGPVCRPGGHDAADKSGDSARQWRARGLSAARGSLSPGSV